MKIEYSEAEIRRMIINHTLQDLDAYEREEMSCEVIVLDEYGVPIAGNGRWVKAVVTLPEQV